jgi:hypothetical protein
MLLAATRIIGHHHAFFVEVINAFGIGDLRVVGSAKNAETGGCVCDKVNYLEPLRCDRERRHGHVHLV